MNAVALESGLEIPNPLDRLVRFCDAEYQYYDTLPKGAPDRIEPIDVLATVGVNSGVIRSAAILRSIHLGTSGDCDHLLAQIPVDADLRIYEHLDLVTDLVCASMQTKWVGHAVATKILHRKRPNLIPMFDSVVAKHYATDTDRLGILGKAEFGDARARRTVIEFAFDGFRDDFSAASTNIESLKSELSGRGYNLAPLRVLEILIWNQLESRAYYR